MKNFYLLVLSGLVFVWALGTAAAADAVVEAGNGEGSIQRAVFKVENMTCRACFSTIHAGVSPLKGFAGMGINLFRKRLAVDFVAPLSADKIGAAITGKGYPTTLESVDPIMEKEGFAYLNTRQKGAGAGGCCGGGTAVAGKEPLPLAPSGIKLGGSCCTLPNGASLPPAAVN